MNYSGHFRAGVIDFLTPTSYMPSVTITDIDRDCIFCYIKSTPMYKLATSRYSGDVVLPLKMNEARPVEITKAEDIMSYGCIGGNEGVSTINLHGEIYYACKGLVFNQDRSPIIVHCIPNGIESANHILCFDYSVLEHPEAPMNRFILRKLIPFVVSERMNSPFNHTRYAIMNCKSFIVKPTFQGELDHALVGEYLAQRIINELGNVSESAERTRVPE